MILWIEAFNTSRVVFETSSTVLAYLDPGTGSYVLQLMLASFFGGLFAFRHAWSSLKLRVSGWLAGNAVTADRALRQSESLVKQPPTQQDDRSVKHGQRTAKIR